MTLHTLITAEASVQMGVVMQLKGTDYWFNYLDTEVDEANIDEEERDAWEEKYDGYEMVWTFSGPAVTVADGNIDAACIYGLASDTSTDSYSGGGYCCGIMYVGNFSSQPEIWAVWFD